MIRLTLMLLVGAFALLALLAQALLDDTPVCYCRRDLGYRGRTAHRALPLVDGVQVRRLLDFTELRRLRFQISNPTVALGQLCLVRLDNIV